MEPVAKTVGGGEIQASHDVLPVVSSPTDTPVFLHEQPEMESRLTLALQRLIEWGRDE